MAYKKKRVKIPQAIEDQVGFESDMTCCICRAPRTGVQIHHIDGNPSNNRIDNLVALCPNCHSEVAKKGGSTRQWSPSLIKRYREDWLQKVGRNRAQQSAAHVESYTPDDDSTEIGAEVEALKARKDYEGLAILYDVWENSELRDKYVDLTLLEDPDDETIIFLRGLQQRPDLVPPEVIEREERRLEEMADWTSRGRMFQSIGRPLDAAKDYIRGIEKLLNQGNFFSAAFYAKEFEQEGLRDALFVDALKNAEDRGDLWWQIRSLQELGWHDQLKDKVLRHRQEIEKSGDLLMIEVLAGVTGDYDRLAEVRVLMAEEGW